MFNSLMDHVCSTNPLNVLSLNKCISVFLEEGIFYLFLSVWLPIVNESFYSLHQAVLMKNTERIELLLPQTVLMAVRERNQWSQWHSQSSQTSNMKIVNDFQPLIFFAKSFILDVWLGSEGAFGSLVYFGKTSLIRLEFEY